MIIFFSIEIPFPVELLFLAPIVIVGLVDLIGAPRIKCYRRLRNFLIVLYGFLFCLAIVVVGVGFSYALAFLLEFFFLAGFSGEFMPAIVAFIGVSLVVIFQVKIRKIEERMEDG